MSEIRNHFTLRQHLRRGIKKAKIRMRRFDWKDAVSVFCTMAIVVMLIAFYTTVRS